MSAPPGHETVEAFLRAMQSGPTGEDALVALFAEDGVYVQGLVPRGRPRTYRGRTEIRKALRDGLRWNPPDFSIHLDRLELEAGELVAWWTCTSEKLPRPMRGIDRYTIRDGLIARLETRLHR